MAQRPELPDGFVAVVKRDCPTCELVAPVLAQLAASGAALTVYTQDDPSFPDGLAGVVDDTDLEVSYHHDIETVPSLIVVDGGAEVERTVGWHREHWRRLTGLADLGADLPDMRPGCGSLSVDPTIAPSLAVRFSDTPLMSRRVELALLEDEFEAMYDRGWSDGLPLVPPTEERVMAMLSGTTRSPDEVVALIPPDLVECTVEKVATNAVMAGCRPEYLPIVLTAVAAACTDEFNMHGLLATTYFSGPVVIVSGPITTAIGMNCRGNVLGQGNRANSTIGRALQLVVRNVGGGRPQGVDRAAFGSPGKVGFCFAEDHERSPWETLNVEAGFPAETSTVTLFAGHGPTAAVDQRSRTPESLVRSIAAVMRADGHPKLMRAFDAALVVGPEHGRVFRDGGWSKARFREELRTQLLVDGGELVRGVDGIAEGMSERVRGTKVPKFRDGIPLIAYAGGDTGMFSAILGGWAGGSMGSQVVTREVQP